MFPLGFGSRTMQVGIARSDPPGMRGTERNDGLAREVVVFEKGKDNLRGFSPPDGIAEEDHLVIGHIPAFSVDGRPCRRIVLLAVGTGKRIVIVQIPGGVNHFGHDAPGCRIGCFEVNECLSTHTGGFSESRIKRRKHAHGSIQRLSPNTFEIAGISPPATFRSLLQTAGRLYAEGVSK